MILSEVINLYSLVASLGLILCLLFLPNISFIFAVSNQSLTFEDNSLGFGFKYPAMWSQLLEKDLKGTGVHFSPLPTYPKEVFADLLIYTSYHQENKTLEQYFHEFISEQLCCIGNQSLKYNKANISGIQSINASWNLTKEDDQVYGKSLLNFAIKDGVAYVIHYDASLKTFYRWLPEVKKIINSFEILD